MDVKGYYKLLNVDPNASEKEIKSAYRALAKKYHSDGLTVANALKACKTDKEREQLKKEMDAKFSEITNAYEVLSVPEKKAMYDKGIDPNQQGGGFEGFGDGESFFSSFFGGSMGSMFGGERRQQKNNPKVEKVHLTLADVMNEIKLTRKITRNIICKPCKATGSMSTKTCTKCRGHGVYSEITNMGGIRLQREVTCNTCRGHGIIKSGPSCTSCSGQGYTKKVENIEITIPAGVTDEYKLSYKGMGDEAEGLVTGDLIVVVSIKEDPNFTRLTAEHLYTEVKVPIGDILMQKPIEITTIDKRVITVGYPTASAQDIGEDYLRIDNEGMPMRRGNKGSLFVRIVPILPPVQKIKDLGTELLNYTASTYSPTHRACFISKHDINKWYNNQQNSSSHESHSRREESGPSCQTA
ncbi:hypothetical protein NEIG_00866 [Nematocida sp. ERTm5]|nr:hypothetical protein NEIRO02_0837 [Nematocida sp. AWRm79]KAI5183317.1 hypothetical protein NEIRO03_0923 [Nematocida sp. AWRm78]OAG33048.1 hypothetical protein NEIG_00866 [Nematocida sp. ERTm5]